MVQKYSPKIIDFLCRWCSYAGADLAGAMRLQYPPNIRIIQVPCTGKVDILHLLQAFEVGADAVFVSGCHQGDCHYMAGNYYARKRVERTKALGVGKTDLLPNIKGDLIYADPLRRDVG